MESGLFQANTYIIMTY